MALADYTPPSVVIESNGKPLMQVRGLSLEDVAMLVRVHMEDLQRLYDMVQANRQSSSDLLGQIAQDDFILKLLTDLPILAGQLIAIAADEPDMGDAARKLPLSLQISAMQAIMRLTCEDIGGPKALVALIRGMILQAEPQARAATIQ